MVVLWFGTLVASVLVANVLLAVGDILEVRDVLAQPSFSHNIFHSEQGKYDLECV